jgi:deoxycytidine triphosphate deaminase
MHSVITEDKLKNAVENNTFIKKGNLHSCEGIKYDFTLSDYVISRELGRPIHLKEQKNIKATIAPGEIAFVMSEEELELPNTVFCQLSPKRKLSLDGIIILGGLIVDPQYKGKLIFGLYNASSAEYPILYGKKLIAGVFFEADARLEGHSLPVPIEDFPNELVQMVARYTPNSSKELQKELGELKDDIRDLKNRLATDETWKDTFKSGLDSLQRNVDELRSLVKDVTVSLSDETKVRTNEVHRLEMQHANFTKDFNSKKKYFYYAVLVLVGVLSYVFGRINLRSVLEKLLTYLG